MTDDIHRSKGGSAERQPQVTRGGAPRRYRPGLLARVLCATGALGAFAAAGVICGAITARARAGELVQDAGEVMLTYARSDARDAPRVVHVNGLALRLMSGHTRDDVSSVLDLFDRRCRQRDAGLEERVAPSGGARTALAAADPRLLQPVLRGGNAGNGYLACLDLGPGELDVRQLVVRLQSFAATFDLAELGDLRFVWARAEQGGTAYVAVWSEGPVRLAPMFPREGDVPGLDPSALPRPPGARRVLSAWQERESPLLTAYRAELPLGELHTRYRGALIDGGFVVREGGQPSSAQRWLIATRAASSTIVLIRAEGPARSSLTVLPLH